MKRKSINLMRSAHLKNQKLVFPLLLKWSVYFRLFWPTWSGLNYQASLKDQLAHAQSTHAKCAPLVYILYYMRILVDSILYIAHFMFISQTELSQLPAIFKRINSILSPFRTLFRFTTEFVLVSDFTASSWAEPDETNLPRQLLFKFVIIPHWWNTYVLSNSKRNINWLRSQCWKSIPGQHWLVVTSQLFKRAINARGVNLKLI